MIRALVLVSGKALLTLLIIAAVSTLLTIGR